jgi:hypothetical protein
MKNFVMSATGNNAWVTLYDDRITIERIGSRLLDNDLNIPETKELLVKDIIAVHYNVSHLRNCGNIQFISKHPVEAIRKLEFMALSKRLRDEEGLTVCNENNEPPENTIFFTENNTGEFSRLKTRIEGMVKGIKDKGHVGQRIFS